MSFTSFDYLIFFPVVFLIYWLLCYKSKNTQNGLIVCASLFFYGWWDWRFLGLLAVTALSTYFAGLWMEKVDSNNKKRRWISIGVIVLNIGILFYYKYFNFFIQSFTDTFSLFEQDLQVSTLKIILPVGISFYIFTALSYSLDVYSRKVKTTRDILAYLAYVTFFPSILCGPISRATKQLPQYYEKRIFDYGKIVSGCKLVLWGGVMKMCVADRLGIYVDSVYNNIAQHNGTTLLFASILYTIQIYADFAGYSLMAIGSGKLLEIELQTNFVRPYFAKTVTDFWRRWHISLTTWFRDYIYFPLGGNRVKKSRWMLNTMIVFVVSGLWHGAAYTFLIWGAMHGLCMVIEKMVYGEKIKQISDKLTIQNVIRIFLTFNIVSIAWIFFRAPSIGDAFTILRKIFTTNGSIFIDGAVFMYALPMLLLVTIVEFCQEFYYGRIKLFNNKRLEVRWAAYLVVLGIVLLFGVFENGAYIYFQF